MSGDLVQFHSEIEADAKQTGCAARGQDVTETLCSLPKHVTLGTYSCEQVFPEEKTEGKPGEEGKLLHNSGRFTFHTFICHLVAINQNFMHLWNYY